jgi:uncharacterized protein (DUF1778 family)
MTKRAPVTGLADAELAQLAEEAYEQRDNPDAWDDEEAPEISPDVRSVVSVRFNKGELGPIERAAAAAGVPVSTYIRNAALSSASPVDVVEARRSVQMIEEALADLNHSLGTDNPKKARRSSGSTTKKRAAA